MQTKDLQMKRTLRSVLLVLLLSVVGITKMYAYYDFSAVCETGQTLYYKIIDANNHYVRLIYPGNSDSSPWAGFAKPIGNISLPSTVIYNGITYTVTVIGSRAFYQCGDLTGSLTIPNSVTTIGECAFEDCAGFTGSLIIGNSVTEIGAGAFKNCNGFTGELVIPNSVISIEGNSFYGGAFENCAGFTGSLTIPNSVTTIGEWAFSRCNGFTGGLTISNSVTIIGECAFEDCAGFTGSLNIPNSVTTISGWAFVGCSGFTGTLTIPNSVTTVGISAFGGCSGFTGSLTIPNSVTYLAGFNGCSGFTGELIIPNSVISIGNSAFENCSGFTGGLTIPNSVVTIEGWAFANCIGFSGCLTIPNSVATIEGSAFANCTGFSGCLTIPNSVTVIGDNPFSGCSGLEQIVVDSTNPIYDSRENCNSIIETFSNTLITGCRNTVIPNSVTEIGSRAFANNGNLTGSLSFPNSVTTIGNYAFYGCSGFTGSLTIGNSVTTIGDDAFNGCSGFTGSLTIPNSVTTIGGYAFNGCTGFSGSLTIPNSVTSIGNCAFQHCRFMGGLIIPNSITTIGSGTFNMCWYFTSVIIPEAVTSIGKRAFACWYNLQSMSVLAINPPILEDYAFANVNKSIPVYVPAGSLSAYQAASGWNEFTNYHEYVPTSYTITASANPADGGLVTGGGTYTQGTTCTLMATTNEGYNFINWTENDEIVSTNANYSFTVSGDRNLVAHFVLDGNHWTPDGSAYSEIMAMYSVIQIDGVEQYSNTLEVGVFCGDECRGSANASEFNLTHRYLAILNVFGENGHQLTFKLYDHSIGQELNLTSPTAVTFNVNGYGNPIEPYVLNFTSTVTHTQPLASGWNWWSTYIEQNGIDGLGMLENSIGSAGVRIQGRNGTVDQFEYQGSSYWYGSLNAITNEQMYKIRTNTACNAEIIGNVALPANHPITINGGWNWIGFPCNQSVSIDAAMSTFTPEANDVIKGRNGSTTYVSYGSTSLWYGTLNTLEPGQGYMYKSNSSISKTLTFQTGRGEEAITNVANENSFFTPNAANFSDNMLVTAVIEMDGQELYSEDYEVAAYVGNECRGSVRLMYVEPFDRYVAFLLVFGEAVEDIHFVLTDGNDIAWSDDLLTYATDGLEGTLTEPMTLHFGTLGLNESEQNFVNVFPNPSNGVFNIEGNGLRKIEVINACGQTILLKEVEGNLMQIDLGNKANGIYLLRVITNNGITTKQFIKE